MMNFSKLAVPKKSKYKVFPIVVPLIERKKLVVGFFFESSWYSGWIRDGKKVHF